jgi:hypothetical protein
MAGGIRFTMPNADKVGKQFTLQVAKFTKKQRRAINKTALRAADEIEYQGRADIAKSGNFGSQRWQSGLQALVSFRGEGNAVIRVTHAVKYWKVFEYGAKILGRPLLWIPLSFGNAFGVRARDYPKPLFRVNRPGKAPLLLDDQGPQYFGKESVTIPRKWHLRTVVNNVSNKMGRIYREAMKNG